MHYTYEVTIGVSNDIYDPIAVPMHLSTGHLKHVSIKFPPGTGGHAHIIITDDSRQLMPLNQDADYAYDDYPVEADLWEPIVQSRNTFYAIGWNTDASWEHTIRISLDVEGPDEPNIYKVLGAYNQMLEKFIDTIRSIF